MSDSPFLHHVASGLPLFIRQRFEGAELVGIESRNRYLITDGEKRPLAEAEEQSTGLAGAVLRQFLRHHRRYEVTISVPGIGTVLSLHHPFCLYFHSLQVKDATGKPLGTVRRRFGILSKIIEILPADGREMITMRAGLFRIWSFPFQRGGQTVATVTKRWGGAIKEIFTDADTFEVTIEDRSLPLADRNLILSAAFLIDALYFDENQRRR